MEQRSYISIRFLSADKPRRSGLAIDREAMVVYLEEDCSHGMLQSNHLPPFCTCNNILYPKHINRNVAALKPANLQFSSLYALLIEG
jgi:hypothetical protein